MHTHPLWHEVKRVDSTDPGEHHSWPAAPSVIVIEHNLDVIRNADWIIDLGPEGGSRGGEIVLTGTPTDLLAAEQSLIGQYLRRAEPAAA